LSNNVSTTISKVICMKALQAHWLTVATTSRRVCDCFRSGTRGLIPAEDGGRLAGKRRRSGVQTWQATGDRKLIATLAGDDEISTVDSTIESRDVLFLWALIVTTVP
jgi:hypothetical protein